MTSIFSIEEHIKVVLLTRDSMYHEVVEILSEYHFGKAVKIDKLLKQANLKIEDG